MPSLIATYSSKYSIYKCGIFALKRMGAVRDSCQIKHMLYSVWLHYNLPRLALVAGAVALKCHVMCVKTTYTLHTLIIVMCEFI
jgi:hypothetical protein